MMVSLQSVANTAVQAETRARRHSSSCDLVKMTRRFNLSVSLAASIEAARLVTAETRKCRQIELFAKTQTNLMLQSGYLHVIEFERVTSLTKHLAATSL